ncbi:MULTISPECIES: S9 family peptidase [unclassified Kaistella]|uniref:alpha/beta hydrolase family protein n=1 Tax=unclassified Kaistella TaxID=2762626 RepID=UPI002735C6DD|nr:MULTISPECIES: alpha/beta hydrolase [unclassified Kaistella]MDP2454406.1 alpha/beta hydrolase [Kaistella sp. SH11-4b]MDP2457893.1 alpha/beta hydrolase [Kaistella sp. SH40-3]MDP2460799.1 alpha/beta hydrolase [Kaistella sp. SH19-2b]
MKTKYLIGLLLLTFQIFLSQNITGSWYGNLDVQGQKLPLVFHIEQEGNDLKSTFDSPTQGAKGIPIQKTLFENNELTLNASNLGITFKGKLNNKKIEGIFSQSGMNFPLILTRNAETTVVNRPQTPKPPFNYNSDDVTFKNDTEGNTLAGTIVTPKNFKKSQPILVMITGSGAQDRNEEMFEHKPFLVIADDLAKKRIATLRLDDRGIGGSEKGKEGATSEDFATDINSAVNYLVKNGYKNIGLIGHSEGGMIAPMVADLNKNVKFLVLLAAPGIPILDLVLDQNKKLAEGANLPQDAIDEVLAIKSKTFTYAKNYKGKDFKTDFTKYLEENFPKMTAQEREAYIAQMSSAWFQYFIKFNPDDYLSKVKIPVLAVDGSLDMQVSAKENLAGIKKSLTKAGNNKFETIEFEGLNHLFQTAKTGNPSEYGQIEETFSPKVLDKISSWILALQ